MVIVTLIAADALSDEMVEEAAGRLRGAGFAVHAPEWIDRGSAADFLLTGEVAAARKALADWNAPVDTVVQDAAGRRKKLIIADMDSTMITVECIDELADYAGIKPQIAAITERAMAGELDFRAALAERVMLLKGMDAGVIDRCLAERVALMPGARTLVHTMQDHGARAVMVSGGFTRFAEPVGAEIGFDRVVANVLEIADGKLTGRVLEPVVDSGVKEATLRAECAAQGIDIVDTLAVGDGANDAPMLAAAGLGVAYRAHSVARAAADASVMHGDLTALLWAQGYARREWRG
ncbi:MAG: phosphoserine phosphatase SerB [Sphingopyxis sp.]|nr:phosphoserine phosphatase SerB [Sphingopyxis sp.]